MGNRTLPVMLAGLLTFGTLLISARNEPQAARAAIPGAANPPTNLGGRMPPSFDQEVARVVAEVDRIEADTLSQIEHTALDRQGQVRTLGKLLLFDKCGLYLPRRAVQYQSRLPCRCEGLIDREAF